MHNILEEMMMNDDTEMTGEQPKQPLLEVRNISKRFPGVQALDDVSVKFYPGEIHAVVGENGAGKSTLMKIMAGAYYPDAGEMFLEGEEISFSHPDQALKKGISIIYQEFNLLPQRTVAQNIFLGREPSKFGLVDERQLNNLAREVLVEIDAEGLISPTTLVGSLSVAEQQMVEIAKAISLNAKILIMDEPTAALTITEVNLLSDLINRLKQRGIAIIFISHRLAEIFAIAEKITVLKDGQLINTVMTNQVTTEDIVQMMVGRFLDHYFPPLGSDEDFGEVVLSIKNASNAKLENISIDLRKGEILGVAGLQGSGRTELAQALFGVEPFKTGSYELNGTTRIIKSPSRAIKSSIGFVTEDRKAEGLCPQQPIRDNILLTVRSIQRLFTAISKDGIKRAPKLVPELGERVDIRTDSFDREVDSLSGGNQQKVILSKWLASEADVFIFDEPTRGIDVQAKASIHDLIRDLTKQGKAVLMISSELPEVIGMSDRILVMHEGYIAGELPAQSSEVEIMRLATGQNGSNGNQGEE
jgi:ABC-type sugar transport system ATPase subunit